MKSDEVEIPQITAENSLDIPLVLALSNSEETPGEVRASNSKIALSFLCSACLICTVVAWPSGVFSKSIVSVPRQLFLPAVRAGVRVPVAQAVHVPQPMQGKAADFPVPDFDDDEDVGPQPGDDEPPILPEQVQMMMRMGGVKASDFPTPVLRTRQTKPLASNNGLLLGRREFAAAAVGGVSLLSGARPALAAAEMVEGATGKAEMLSNEDALKALDNNPGLGLLGSAEITAFYEKLCRETSDKDKTDADVQKLRPQLAYDTRRLLEQGRVDYNLNQVLRTVEKENNIQYEEAKKAAQEAIDLLVRVFDSSSDSTLFGTKSEMLRYADNYKKSRENLLLVFSALPAEEQDRLYGVAQTLPFAQEFEQDIGKLSRKSTKK